MDWSFADAKAFENALAELGHDCPYFFQEIASRLPGKSIEQIKMYYDALVRDVEMIELGHFDQKLEFIGGSTTSNIGTHEPPPKVPRKKPSPWTNDEHE